MKPAAAEIIVEGLVQGVGFRYFCLRNAISLKIVGWCQNHPDGSVILKVEGDKGDIEAFIEELKIGPPVSKVTEVNINWLEFSGQFNKFDIVTN